ncbi:unnamed protein product [Nyctereutes procyonoides]|uniref:(raccoon dog) hypothetical protein n=1 Tax=Nyctereutes procyonoides TaxID=34880 RepID=A0A811YZE2_NYCPR|nr:unnamed protein product [Nyctereutes procyonoides]
MAGILHSIVPRPPDRQQTIGFITNLPRIPDEAFHPLPADHEKYGGGAHHPHKLHIVTRIKTHTPQVHKNIPSVNARLQVVKHLNSSNVRLRSPGESVVRGHRNPVGQESS